MKFKNYTIEYCGFCEGPIITCQICKYASCTGGGCDKCHDDYIEFFQFEKDNQAELDIFFEKEIAQAVIDKQENKKRELEMLKSLGLR